MAPNPLQPLIDAIGQNTCKMNSFIQAVNAMLGQTPRATTLSITTTPAKAPYASVKVVSVQSSSTPLLAANPKRRGFAVKNMSVGTIYVSPNKNLTIAGGGDPGWPVLSNNAEHNDTYTGPVYAVVAAPGPLDLYVWEEFDL